MLTSLPLDSQASALGLCSQLGICSSHLAVLSVMSFTLVCKYGLLFSFSTFSKLSVRLTAWKVERRSMERTKTLVLIYECELLSVHHRLSLCDLVVLNEIVPLN